MATPASSMSDAAAAPIFTRFIWTSSERKPRAETPDARRCHARHIAERAARDELGAGRRRQVQQVERIDVDAEPPAARHPEILVRAEVQDVECFELLTAVRLETHLERVRLRDRRPAIGVVAAEDMRALPFDTRFALQESRYRDVVERPVRARHSPGP